MRIHMLFHKRLHTHEAPRAALLDTVKICFAHDLLDGGGEFAVDLALGNVDHLHDFITDCLHSIAVGSELTREEVEVCGVAGTGLGGHSVVEG